MKTPLARSSISRKPSGKGRGTRTWLTLALISVTAASLAALQMRGNTSFARGLRASVSVGRLLQPSGFVYTVNSTGDANNSPISTRAGSCNVNPLAGNECTLRAAIEIANTEASRGVDNNIINFNIPTTDPGYNNGTWTINLGTALPDLSSSIEFDGPGADKLTVQRNSSSQFRIFNVTTAGTVTFSGMTVANGATTDTGGGIRVTDLATVNVTSSTISGNSAFEGGGIYSSGKLTVTNSTISGNSAPSGVGGGIFNISTSGSSPSTANITNSTIINNSSGNGGGIANEFGHTVTVTSSRISGNSAQLGDGGGIFNLAASGAPGTANITNSTITNNSASGSGGGIRVTDFATVNVTSTTISDNLAFSTSQAGGGIYSSGRLTVTNSTISGNSAPSGVGGGIYNDATSGGPGTADITDSTITNNSASGGGGIDNEFGNAVTVTSSTITNNSVSFSGGGIRGGVNMTNSTISGNSARFGDGGGISITDAATVNLASSTISGNSSSRNGGGITSSGKLTVTNSTISGNSAQVGDGGGIFNISTPGGPGTANITNSTITKNSASGNGGGIDNKFGGTFNVKSNIVALNAAGGSGQDVFATFTSAGFNLIGRNDGATTSFPAGTPNANNDIVGTFASPVDPQLDPAGLKNNGGPTQTIALLFGSPAIDKGTRIGLNGPLTADQRVTFPRTIDDPSVANAAGGDGTDIGAFEVQSAAPTPTPTPTPTPPPMTVQFSASSYPVGEGDKRVDTTITRSGDTSGAASVSFATSDLAGAQNCNVKNGVASSRCDYEARFATVKFAPGETSRTISVFIIDDSYLEGPETLNVNLSNPVGASLGTPATATVTISDNDLADGPNPIDTPGFYVRLHYLDFLNREPDQNGLDFWTGNITSCGADQQCIDVKRINVSAAFYLSIEFQQTGDLVERIYKAAYGDASGPSALGGPHQLAVPIVRLNEFLLDTQQIGQGVVVGQPGWETVLENNKQAFAADFVQRSRFTNAFISVLTPAQFVDTLFVNAGVTPSPSDRNAAINEFSGASDSSNLNARARALREVAENSSLNQQEFNRAFVLMQFFGYLRRNPNDPQDSDYTGYDFWLTKLNQFNGNYVNAEMVKAFVASGEYRHRFGP